MSDALHSGDPRLLAELQYDTNDDGIWLVYETQRVNLGFWPSVEDVVEAAERLQPASHPGSDA